MTDISYPFRKELETENEINGFSQMLCAQVILLRLSRLLLDGFPSASSTDEKILYYLRKIPAWFSAIRRLPYQQYQFATTLEEWIAIYDEYFQSYHHKDLLNTCISPSGAVGSEMNERLYDALHDLHHRLNTSVYRRKLTTDKQSVNNNYDSYVSCVHKLFSLYARLVVIRLDFGYSTDASFEQMRKDLDALANNARHNAMFDHMEWYITKIEYGLEKGLHAHTLFFFNGHKRLGSSDVHLAQEIGEYWRDVVTQGHGTYWNCNANKHEYRYLGIGLIHATDNDKISNLMKAVKYFCKRDRQVIKPRCAPQAKTLTRGHLHNHNPNLGRPRNA